MMDDGTAAPAQGTEQTNKLFHRHDSWDIGTPGPDESLDPLGPCLGLVDLFFLKGKVARFCVDWMYIFST